MAVFLLLFAGCCAAAQARPATEIRTDFECTHDYEKMSCQLERPNCSEYDVTLRNDQGYGGYNCSLQQCDGKQCCCSVIITAVPGETFTAELRTREQLLGSKTIDIFKCFKPKRPTLLSVKESGGNFGISWNKNMAERLTAEVTFHKKGDVEKVTRLISPAEVDGLQFYEIGGQSLEPNSTYVVSVRSLSRYNNMFSDSSNQMEFRTRTSVAASSSLPLIIVLVFCAVFLSAAIFFCFVKLNRKINDLPKPKLSPFSSSNRKLLEPEQDTVSIPTIQSSCEDDDEDQILKTSYEESEGSGLSKSTGSTSTGSEPSYGEAEPQNVTNDIHALVLKALPWFQILSSASSSSTEPMSVSDGTGSASFSDRIGSSGLSDRIGSGSSEIFNESYNLFHRKSGFPEQFTKIPSNTDPEGDMDGSSSAHNALLQLLGQSSSSCSSYGPVKGPAGLRVEDDYKPFTNQAVQHGDHERSLLSKTGVEMPRSIPAHFPTLFNPDLMENSQIGSCLFSFPPSGLPDMSREVIINLDYKSV